MSKITKHTFVVKLIILLLIFITIIITIPISSLATDNVDEIDISSRIALIYDRASGKILYQKNGNKQTPMASTTNVTDT